MWVGRQRESINATAVLCLIFGVFFFLDNYDDDDDELNINPPTPFQIGKRPPAPKPKENWPAVRESQVEGSRGSSLRSKRRPTPRASARGCRALSEENRSDITVMLDDAVVA